MFPGTRGRLALTSMLTGMTFHAGSMSISRSEHSISKFTRRIGRLNLDVYREDRTFNTEVLQEEDG